MGAQAPSPCAPAVLARVRFRLFRPNHVNLSESNGIQSNAYKSEMKSRVENRKSINRRSYSLACRVFFPLLK
ncbi:hypothetical protein PUN4_160075 [Paraburkholderia unamae]|nr:hypothetical protein PUN4_160075 [Paraburkholderia unamae]